MRAIGRAMGPLWGCNFSDSNDKNQRFEPGHRYEITLVRAFDVDFF